MIKQAPLLLRAIIRMYWPLILGGVVGVVYLVRKAWLRESSRHKIDAWRHKVPFLRAVLTGLAGSRFAPVR